MRNNEVIFDRHNRFASLSTEIHAVNGMVTEGLHRELIEPPQPLGILDLTPLSRNLDYLRVLACFLSVRS